MLERVACATEVMRHGYSVVCLRIDNNSTNRKLKLNKVDKQKNYQHHKNNNMRKYFVSFKGRITLFLQSRKLDTKLKNFTFWEVILVAAICIANLINFVISWSSPSSNSSPLNTLEILGDSHESKQLVSHQKKFTTCKKKIIDLMAHREAIREISTKKMFWHHHDSENCEHQKYYFFTFFFSVN